MRPWIRGVGALVLGVTVLVAFGGVVPKARAGHRCCERKERDASPHHAKLMEGCCCDAANTADSCGCLAPLSKPRATDATTDGNARRSVVTPVGVLLPVASVLPPPTPVGLCQPRGAAPPAPAPKDPTTHVLR